MTAPVTAPTRALAGARPARAQAARAQRMDAGGVAGALVVGAAAGVAADRVWLGRQQRVAPASWLDAFAADLALTAAQRAAVDTILDERQRVMDSLVAPVRPGLDAARAAARRQIRARLSPGQQAQFDAYVARIERERRAGVPAR